MDAATSPPGGVLRGLAQFNAREFYECHDSIEEEWRRERGEIRVLWQGILQAGVAFHHVQRGKAWPALTMLGRALPKLRRFAPRCQGIDVAALIAACERGQEEIRRLGPGRVAEFDAALFPVIGVERPAAP